MSSIAKTIEPRMIDYNNIGKKDCMVDVGLELTDNGKGPIFIAKTTIWNPEHTDCYVCGQCFDDIVNHFNTISDEELLEYFPNYPLFEEIYNLWFYFHIYHMSVSEDEPGEIPEEALERIKELIIKGE